VITAADDAAARGDARAVGNEVGVFTYAQALAAGWTQGTVRRELRAGRWIRLRRGSFIRADELAAASEGRRHAIDASAAMLGLRTTNGVITGRSAALLHGLPLLLAPPRTVELTVERSQRESLPGLTIRTTTLPFDADQVTTIDDLPVTTVARTVVDLADRTTRMEAAVLIDDALRRTLCDRDDLTRSVAARRPRYHLAAITELIDDADPGCATTTASALRRYLIDHGLPRPDRQQPRSGDADAVVLHWSTVRVAVIDRGDPVHHRALAIAAGLEAAGWTCVVVDHHDVQHRPHEVRDAVRHALLVARTRRRIAA
jgi:hypothetical protein